MTKSERNRFRAILTAKVVELECLTALGRIHEGSYGTCRRSDEDIHPKRLAAVSWAAFCIRCQEAIDHNPEEMQTPTCNLLARAA